MGRRRHTLDERRRADHLSVNDLDAAGVAVAIEPGKDQGLLPVNCLLGQIEELMAGQNAPASLAPAVQQARQWVDNIFATTGQFDAPALKRFGDWVAWGQAALSALENNRSPAPWSCAEAAPVSETAAATLPPVRH